MKFKILHLGIKEEAKFYLFTCIARANDSQFKHCGKGGAIAPVAPIASPAAAADFVIVAGDNAI